MLLVDNFAHLATIEKDAICFEDVYSLYDSLEMPLSHITWHSYEHKCIRWALFHHIALLDGVFF